MSKFKLLVLTALLGAGNVISLASASPITLVDGPYLFLGDKGENDINQGIGEFIAIGDDAVLPTAGTTVSAQTTNLATGASVTVPIPFVGSTVLPDQFGTDIGYHADRLGAWTLTFNNGADTTSATTPGTLIGVSPAPFASNVTISGSSTNPTFSWTFPSNSVNNVSIGIFDDSMKNAGGGVDQVYSTVLARTSGSFTVPNALAGGLSLQLNHKYTIDIAGIVDRVPPPPGPPSQANILTATQSFFDFTPLPAGAPLVNLPAVTPLGVYQYTMTVVAGTTYFVDPTVAVGYSFAIGAGDPKFASVLLPAVQANPFDVSFVYDGIDYSKMVSPEMMFDFPADGVDAFTVTGIDPADGLDPGDTTAFITGLTFTGDGTFNGTQTPITEVVGTPEPGSIALLASSLLGLLLFRQGRRSALVS